MTESPWRKARRIVIKIGSALVTRADGRFLQQRLIALTQEMVNLRACNREVILVTSGAIAAGKRILGLHGYQGLERPLTLEQAQAAAAIGQTKLASAWQKALATQGITMAQILLTQDDTENRRRHLNARSTLNHLLALDVLPVINENDSVATDEIRFGDNDRLAARVAQMISADCLILLSDIDGLYSSDPRYNSQADHIPLVSEITSEIKAMAGKAPPGYSSGGMITKLEAARIAMSAGCYMAIADGRRHHPLTSLDQGDRATWFIPCANPPAARKRWIAASMKSNATLTVDQGAVRALQHGKSLLPAGVKSIQGNFARGDCVLLQDMSGHTLGRGLIAYSAGDARRILGCRGKEIALILGFRGREELIHRDDLVLELQSNE